jgi:hypothetical protein
VNHQIPRSQSNMRTSMDKEHSSSVCHSSSSSLFSKLSSFASTVRTSSLLFDHFFVFRSLRRQKSHQFHRHRPHFRLWFGCSAHSLIFWFSARRLTFDLKTFDRLHFDSRSGIMLPVQSPSSHARYTRKPEVYAFQLYLGFDRQPNRAFRGLNFH